MSYDEMKSETIAEIPLGEVQQYKIVAVHYVDGEGSNKKIGAYKLDNGQEIDVPTACAMADAGQLPGYRTGENRYGVPFIRGVADGEESNNLEELPRY